MIVNKPKKKKTISRYAVLYIIMAVIFGTIFCKLLYLQVYKYDEYKEKADTSSTKFISESAPRGLIYDSEGNVLATSEQTYVLTYMQTTESANAIFSTLNKVFKVLSENGENFEDNLLLKVNSDGQFYFAFKSDDSDVKDKLIHYLTIFESERQGEVVNNTAKIKEIKNENGLYRVLVQYDIISKDNKKVLNQSDMYLYIKDEDGQLKIKTADYGG